MTLGLDERFLKNASSLYDAASFLMFLEPHIIYISTSSPLRITSSLCCFIFYSRAMAGNDKSKSLSEPKNWQATRVEPAAAPAPRNLSGNKRKDPATVVEPAGQRVEEGDNALHQPITLIFCDDSLPPPKHGRRRYTEEERCRVADTRKRGACEACRKTRTRVCFLIGS
jgi:hypothetical protein